MRYFLEYKGPKVSGWFMKNTSPITTKNIVEVEPIMFKDTLARMGIKIELPEDKINNNRADLNDVAATTAFVLEDAMTMAEMLVYALEEIEKLKGGV